MFHLECVIAWFESDNARRGSCPNCRRELFEAPPLSQAQLGALDVDMMDLDDQETDVDEPYYDPPMSDFIDDSDASPIPRRVRRRRANLSPVVEPHPGQPPPRGPMPDPRPWQVMYETQASRDETDAAVAMLLAAAREVDRADDERMAAHPHRFDELRNRADGLFDGEVEFPGPEYRG